ncbi:allantoin permease [Leekyejoonella antrihumi]|uniref:Allantoin permease n=2 Tax=Leekyejoonella antrihumi TaxID=1660198 RepID=A0A563E1J6_9MICO|nr:allantoin permease [Leekyejoonella antrihumi]
MSLSTRSSDEKLWQPTAEVPRTLDEEAPRTLTVRDQIGLWANLGISLMGFAGAIVVLQPHGPGTAQLGIPQAMLAIVVGTIIGTAAIAVAGLPGARTGQPAMVLLRGLFGGRLSYLPTGLNIVQLIGWGVFEIVIIATAVTTLTDVPRWPVIVVAGLLSIALSIYPLKWVKVLRRYVTAAVVIAMIYLGIRLLADGLPHHSGGGWSGFAISVDACIAVSVSWVPVVADYSRHSTSPRASVIGTFTGYAVTQICCYGLGLAFLIQVAGDTNKVFAAFLAVPLGALCFTIISVREVDQSFVDLYSATMSIQNIRPRWDRRIISVVLGVLITVLALSINIYGFAGFLTLIGSVFVPLLAVMVVDYFGAGGRRTWDLTEQARHRPLMLLPWVVGFVAYQMTSPGEVDRWSSLWVHLDDAVGFVPQEWMSASVCSFIVAAVATAAVHLAARALGRRA